MACQVDDDWEIFLGSALCSTADVTACLLPTIQHAALCEVFCGGATYVEQTVLFLSAASELSKNLPKTYEKLTKKTYEKQNLRKTQLLDGKAKGDELKTS